MSNNETVGLEFKVDSKSGQKNIEAMRKKVEDLQQSLGKTGNAGRDSAKKLDKMNTSSTGAAKGMSKAGSASKGMGASAAVMGGAVIAATAAVAGLAIGTKALIGFLKESVEAGNEQIEVNGRAISTLKGLGLSSKQAAQQLGEYGSVIGQLSKETGVGDEALMNALSTMNNLSQEAKTTEEAQRDLSFALAASAQTGKSVEETSKLIAKAYNGEARGAKDLLGLNKEQVEELNKMQDAGERTAKITNMLTERFGDQLTNLSPLQVSQKNVTNAYGDMQQALGMAITQSGAFEPILDSLTGVLREAESWVQNNEEAIRSFVFNGVDKAIEMTLGLMETLQNLSPVFAGMITYVRVATGWYKALVGGVKVVGKSLLALGSKVISYVTERWSEFFDAAAKVADFLGLDLADSFRSASNGLQGFSDSADRFSDGLFDDILDDSEGVRDNLVGMTDALLDAPDAARFIDEKIGQLRERIKKMREDVAQAKDTSRDLADDDGNPSRPTPESPTPKANEKDLQKAEKELELLEARKLRNEAATRELEIETAIDERKRAQLEMNFRLWELEQENLTGAEKKLETHRTIVEFQRQQAEIAEREKQAQVQAREEAKKRRAEELKAVKKASEARQKALQASVNTSKQMGDVLIQGFQAAGVEARGISLIRGAQFAADAIGMAMTNPLGAIKAGIGAAQHFAVAAGAGGGSSSGSGGGGSASRGRQAQQRDPKEQNERLAELFAEKLKSQEQSRELVLNIDLSNSVTLGQSHETAQQIADSVSTSLQNSGIDLNRLRN